MTDITIQELIERAHGTAKDRGWYDPPKSFGEELFLIAGEVHEAGEEYRNGYGFNEIYYRLKSEFGERERLLSEEDFMAWPEDVRQTFIDKGLAKPEGIPIELADVLIRLADACGHRGIDLVKALQLKMEFNLTRPSRHGGKVI